MTLALTSAVSPTNTVTEMMVASRRFCLCKPHAFPSPSGETEARRGREYRICGLVAPVLLCPGGRVPGHHTETSIPVSVFSEAQALAVPLLKEEADVRGGAEVPVIITRLCYPEDYVLQI